jgi:hypothetical protein
MLIGSFMNWKVCVVSQLDNLRLLSLNLHEEITEPSVGIAGICPEFWTRVVSNTK